MSYLRQLCKLPAHVTLFHHSQRLLIPGDLMDVYASCQELYTGLDDRERGPADELPVLAAGCLATAAALSVSEQQATEHLLQVRGTRCKLFCFVRGAA